MNRIKELFKIIRIRLIPIQDHPALLQLQGNIIKDQL